MKTHRLPIAWQVETIITIPLLMYWQASPIYVAWRVFCYHIVAIVIEAHIKPETCTTTDPDHQYFLRRPTEILATNA